MSIRRNNTRFLANVSLKHGLKEIAVTCATESSFLTFWSIIVDLLRFESLFDGCFYPIVSLYVDNKDYSDDVKSEILAYYLSNQRNGFINHSFSNTQYRKLFYSWKRYEKALDITNPVFLYSFYTNGLTVDVRLALLLQVFEPISIQENMQGELSLNCSPYITHSARCPNCGTTDSKSIKNKQLHFEDELRAILHKYGTTIFEGDDTNRLLKKAVASRNRIDHVLINKADLRKCLSAEQSGFYLQKFALLYRIIVLQYIGVDARLLDDFTKNAVTSLNRQFQQYRLKKR